jgi:hypothetical protein
MTEFTQVRLPRRKSAVSPVFASPGNRNRRSKVGHFNKCRSRKRTGSFKRVVFRDRSSRTIDCRRITQNSRTLSRVGGVDSARSIGQRRTRPRFFSEFKRPLCVLVTNRNTTSWGSASSGKTLRIDIHVIVGDQSTRWKNFGAEVSSCDRASVSVRSDPRSYITLIRYRSNGSIRISSEYVDALI